MLAGRLKLVRAGWLQPKLAPWLAAPLVLLGFGLYFAYDHIVAEYHFRAAQQSFHNRQISDARAHIDVCLRTWPKSAATQLLTARIARGAGFFEEADRRLDNCQRLHGPEDLIKLERALIQVQQGAIGENTEKLLLRYVEHDHHPDSVLILDALSEGCRRTYRIDSAVTYLTKLLKLEPNNVHALMLRGWAHGRLSQWENAREDYARALACEPGNDEALLRLAQALAEGKPREAAGRFEEFLKRQPENPAATLGLARCRKLLDQIEEARQLMDKLVRKHPREFSAVLERGRFALEIDGAAPAEPWLRRAVVLDPFDFQAHFALFRCLKRLGKEKEAAECEKRVKEIETDLKRLEELAEKLQKNPYESGLDYRIEIAQIFMRSGQEREGVLWLKGALQIDPNFVPALKALAEYYEKKGDTLRAREYRERLDRLRKESAP